MDSTMVKITGLWQNEDKKGNKYLSGSMGSAKVLIFKNNYKEQDKHPDYIMYLAPQKKKEEKSDDGL